MEKDGKENSICSQQHNFSHDLKEVLTLWSWEELLVVFCVCPGGGGQRSGGGLSPGQRRDGVCERHPAGRLPSGSHLSGEELAQDTPPGGQEVT